MTGVAAGLRRQVRLVARTTSYELRKAAAFRVGFLVREVLNGIERPIVMIFVYLALFEASGSATIKGFTVDDFIAYLLLAAVARKLVFEERGLDLSDQIFDGYVTKFFVMPFHYFAIVLGRFVQFTGVQLCVAALLWAGGHAVAGDRFPWPVSVAAALQALSLVLLGSYCFFLVYFTVHSLAFWLDRVWSLLGMSRIVFMFVAGLLIPVTIMPDGLRDAFQWLFPYWTINAPVEIFMGHQGTDEFLRGLAIVVASALALQWLALFTWRRGLARYSGVGM